jgi:hypothetical protein
MSRREMFAFIDCSIRSFPYDVVFLKGRKSISDYIAFSINGRAYLEDGGRRRLLDLYRVDLTEECVFSSCRLEGRHVARDVFLNRDLCGSYLNIIL